MPLGRLTQIGTGSCRRHRTATVSCLVAVTILALADTTGVVPLFSRTRRKDGKAAAAVHEKKGKAAAGVGLEAPRMYICKKEIEPDAFCFRPPTIAQLFPEYPTMQEVSVDAGFPDLARQFPEGAVSCLRPESTKAPTERDLVVALHPHECYKTVANFPGGRLYLNPEPYDLHPSNALNDGTRTLDYLPPGDRSVVLGPHEDSGRSICLPAVTWIFNDSFARDHQRKLFDPRRRPRNNGRHFLLYANSHYVEYRERAFFDLSAIGEVHASGGCVGNWESRPDLDPKLALVNNAPCTPFRDGDQPASIVETPYRGEDDGDTKLGWLTNYEAFRNYRFGLVMENLNRDGYVSEKILHAFLGGAVPIYYGTADVFDIFNRNAFIYYDVNSPGEALDRIRFLEDNPREYKKTLRQPILADGERTIEKYFSFDDGVGGGKLKRRIRSALGYHDR